MPKSEALATPYDPKAPRHQARFEKEMFRTPKFVGSRQAQRKLRPARGMSNDAHERAHEERHREGNGALVHARMGVFEVRDVLWGWWRLAPRRGIMHVRAMWKVTC